MDNLTIIGLTGGIACGKSTVAKMLVSLGAHAINADTLTHRLQQPGTAPYQAIVDAFGSDILCAPGSTIDRGKLGVRAFASPDSMQRLEAIMHPAVHAEIEQWLDHLARAHTASAAVPVPAPGPVAVIEAIKLLEAGWQARCASVWVVVCPTEQQVARLRADRGLSEDDARQRLAAQPPQQSRLAFADRVIDTGTTLEATRQQVETAWQHLQQERIRP